MLLDPRLVLRPSHPTLRFGGATSDRIDCGNPTILTNVNTGTICAWVYNTSTSTNQRLWSKGIVANLHHLRLQTSAFAFVLVRATVSLIGSANASSFAAYGTNKWICVVAVWNSGGVDGDQKLYLGDEHVPPAEPSAYGSQAVGSGGVADDSGANFCIGNVAASTTVSWVGSYAFFGMWNRVLPYAEIVQQWRQWVEPSPWIDTMGAINYTLIGPQGFGRVNDWSGYANHGSVTGAVLSGVTAPFSSFQV